MELNVCAYFWDVFDPVNDSTFDQGADSLNYALTLLYNWAARDYASFEDYYTDWLTRGVWGTNERVAAVLRGVNRVEVP